MTYHTANPASRSSLTRPMLAVPQVLTQEENPDASCWGGLLVGPMSLCTPGFVHGKGHFKNKLCPACRRDGLSIPSSRVRAIPAHMRTAFSNSSGQGLWSTIRDFQVAFRVINQTLSCHGPWLVVFRGTPVPPLTSWEAMPPGWDSGESVKLKVAKGTLVPACSLEGVGETECTTASLSPQASHESLMWSPDPYAQQTLGYGAQQMDPVYGASVVPWSAPLAEGAANPLVSPTHVASAAPVHVATAAARPPGVGSAANEGPPLATAVVVAADAPSSSAAGGSREGAAAAKPALQWRPFQPLAAANEGVGTSAGADSACAPAAKVAPPGPLEGRSRKRAAHVTVV